MRSYTLLALLLAGCGSPGSSGTAAPDDGADSLTIFYSSRLEGEIEPCGCPREPLGGLSRRNHVLEQHRTTGPVVVIDAGSSLDPPRSEPDGRDLGQRRLKAELIVDSFLLGGIDAMAVGGHDWKLGSEWLRTMLSEREAPVLAANLHCDGERPWPASTIVEREGRRIGIVGVTLGEVEGCEVREPRAALSEAVASLGEVDLRIGLLPALDQRQVAAVLLDGVDLDLVFTATGMHVGTDPDEYHDTFVYSAGNRGKQVGVLNIEWTPGAEGFQPHGRAAVLRRQIERIEGIISTHQHRVSKASDHERPMLERTLATYEAQLQERREALDLAESDVRMHRLVNREVELPIAMKVHEPTRKLVDRALEEIRSLESPSMLRGLLHPQRIQDNAHWAGSDTCASCHRVEHAQWASTAHSRAWHTLVAEKRDMDMACYSCHATAVGQEGGPQSPGEVRSFRDVQCEACHGPSKAHAENPTAHKPVRNPGPEVCTTCHDGERDGGRFDFDTYRPKIVH